MSFEDSKPMENYPALDVAALRHRTEPSRFALAATACGLIAGGANLLLLAAYGPKYFLVIATVIAAALGSLWLLVQLVRIRNLAAAVKVSRETFPEVQDAIDEIRARLSYERRTDVYIVDKQTPRVTLTSYFGYRVIVMEGSVVADLTTPEGRPGLVFLLTTYFGALKAQHDRWDVALVIFDAFHIVRFMDPFIRPWYRATIYTGDQIAYACCHDLDVSVKVLYARLVGREMASQLHADGLIGQAAQVRRSWILRLSQLLAPAPHPTNRYLNLLSFAAATAPDDLERFAATLTTSRSATLTDLLRLFPVRRPSSIPARVGLVTAAALVVASAVAGVALHVGTTRSELFETAVYPTPTDPTPTDPTPTKTAPTDPTPTEAAPTETAPTVASPVEDLVRRLPTSFATTCRDSTLAEQVDRPLISFSITCQPSRLSRGGLTVYKYDDPDDVDTNFENWVEEIETSGDCAQGIAASDNIWNHDGLEQGRLGCFDSQSGSVIVWTDTDLRIVSIAWSEIMSLQQIYDWWSANAYRGEPF